MTGKLVSIGAVFMMLLAVCCAEGEGGAIAVVDMTKIVKVHPKAADAETVLRKQLKEFEQEQEDMLAELEEAERALREAEAEASSKALSEQGRLDKQKLVARKTDALQRKRRMLGETLRLRQKQLSDQELRMRNRIVREIRNEIEAVAGAKGVSLVLDSSSRGLNGIPAVVYSKAELDLTAEIMERVRKQKAKEE
ncbi:MAG: OmpH family outer membrane protein [Lentisphaerae bacterium]|nr:OmpH family outer membrane protein [Lentisphaerota bacterium]